MSGYTTFDKAIAAFFGSLIAILGFLGFQVPEFFTNAKVLDFLNLVLASFGPAILTWFANNKQKT